MRATQIHTVPQVSAAATETTSPRHKWWKRLAGACAAADCPHRGKLWPAWLRMSAGVLFERRWYCEPTCLKSSVEFRMRNLLSGFRPQKTKRYRLPLGLLLVSRGAISSEQLRRALHLQRQAGTGRLGDWFCRMGVVQEQQIAAALSQQWGCPVFPLDKVTPDPSWWALVPLPLLDSACAAPAHASVDGRVLHIAFGERLDHLLLYAVEQMLDCRTVACVGPEARIVESLSRTRSQGERGEICFETIRDPQEMAWIICNYAVELQARRVALARASSHVWVRFYRSEVARDLLFRVLPDRPSPLLLDPSCETPNAFPQLADSRKDGVSDALGPV